jgi:hypothetical protein
MYITLLLRVLLSSRLSADVCSSADVRGGSKEEDEKDDEAAARAVERLLLDECREHALMLIRFGADRP